jgi:hypothetical protein
VVRLAKVGREGCFILSSTATRAKLDRHSDYPTWKLGDSNCGSGVSIYRRCARCTMRRKSGWGHAIGAGIERRPTSTDTLRVHRDLARYLPRSLTTDKRITQIALCTSRMSRPYRHKRMTPTHTSARNRVDEWPETTLEAGASEAINDANITPPSPSSVPAGVH